MKIVDWTYFHIPVEYFSSSIETSPGIASFPSWYNALHSVYKIMLLTVIYLYECRLTLKSMALLINSDDSLLFSETTTFFTATF